MSHEEFVLAASTRKDTGKGASRRLRRLEGVIPAIVYGGKKKPANITVVHKDLIKHLENEAFYSQVITLNIDDKSESVILKDLQRHPAKPVVMHADFLRVSKTKKLHVNVPLHFINEAACKGVKLGGGSITHNLTQIEVTCLPADIPEFLEVDLKDVELGQVVHISDIALPKGVESVALSHGEDHDLPVATCVKPKGASEDSDDAEEGDAAE